MLTSKDAMNLVNKGKNEKIFLILALSLNIFALQLDEISNTMQKISIKAYNFYKTTKKIKNKLLMEFFQFLII